MFIRSILGKARRYRSVLLLVSIVLFSSLLGSVAVLYNQVDKRAQNDGAERADVIVVLGCQVWPGERPSPALAARTQHGIALYQSGYAPRMILTGGVGTYPPAEAEVMRRVAVAAGVPPHALVLDDQAHSTEESLQNIKKIMDQNGWKSALIVSDPFHLLRAETMARDLGIVAHGSPASNSPTFTIPHLRIWYTAREALALIWYYGERLVGQPAWLYQVLKGRI